MPQHKSNTHSFQANQSYSVPQGNPRQGDFKPSPPATPSRYRPALLEVQRVEQKTSTTRRHTSPPEIEAPETERSTTTRHALIYGTSQKPSTTDEIEAPETERSTTDENKQKAQQDLKNVEGGLTAFLESLVSVVDWTVQLVSEPAKTFIPGILGAVVFSLLGGSVGGIAAAMTVTAMITSIQEKQKQLGLDLQENTIRKIVEPLQGKPFNQSQVQKVIEENVLSDREANGDLEKAFTDLLPTINHVAPTNIKVSGPVYGLTVGDNNTVNMTFHDFLKENRNTSEIVPQVTSDDIIPDRLPSSLEELRRIRRAGRRDFLTRKSQTSDPI